MLGYQITHCLVEIKRKASVPFRFLGLFKSTTDFETMKSAYGTEKANWCAVLNVNSTHWVLLFYDVQKELIIFGDSLGMDLAQYNLPLSSALQIEFGAGNLVHLPGYPIQEAEARTCGLYVVYWVAELSRGVALPNLAGVFPPNRREDNDRRVTVWFRRTFPCLCSATWI